jgi:hypothetical protein
MSCIRTLVGTVQFGLIRIVVGGLSLVSLVSPGGAATLNIDFFGNYIDNSLTPKPACCF